MSKITEESYLTLYKILMGQVAEIDSTVEVLMFEREKLVRLIKDINTKYTDEYKSDIRKRLDA
jgi:hypothetical protein